MSKRKYVHLKVFEEEMLAMKAAGKTRREVENAFGFEQEQIKDFLKRHRRQERKIAAGIKPRPRGCQRKDAESRDLVAEQAYEINCLKMENKLLRDFLRLTGRK